MSSKVAVRRSCASLAVSSRAKRWTAGRGGEFQHVRQIGPAAQEPGDSTQRWPDTEFAERREMGEYSSKDGGGMRWAR